MSKNNAKLSKTQSKELNIDFYKSLEPLIIFNSEKKPSTPTKPQSEEGIRITTIELDEWTEYTRDKPRYIGSKRYLRGDMLGAGTQAKVFEALDVYTLKRRVVKEIFKKREIGRSQERELNSILFECNVIRRLNHPNVIKVYDIYTRVSRNNFEMSIVKEYCSATLTEIRMSRPENRLPIWQAHLYFNQLLEGLDFLHSRGIVHHDIKPDNALVNNDNCLKIIDFGTAQQVKMFQKELLVGSNWGTKQFFGPEKFYGMIDIDLYPGDKADLWAAGVTLFFMATGHHPFCDDEDAEAEMKLRNLIKSGTLQYFPVLNENPGMTQMLKRIFTFDPRMRPNIYDVRNDLWPKLSFKYEDLADIPPRDKFGDKYRSMSMTPYLHQLHYPISEKERAVVVKGDDEAEVVQQKKRIPYVRANRSPPATRSPPDSGSPQSPPLIWE